MKKLFLLLVILGGIAASSGLGQTTAALSYAAPNPMYNVTETSADALVSYLTASGYPGGAVFVNPLSTVAGQVVAGMLPETQFASLGITPTSPILAVIQFNGTGSFYAAGLIEYELSVGFSLPTVLGFPPPGAPSATPVAPPQSPLVPLPAAPAPAPAVTAPTPASCVGNSTGAGYYAAPYYSTVPACKLANGTVYTADPRGSFTFYVSATPFGLSTWFQSASSN